MRIRVVSELPGGEVGKPQLVQGLLPLPQDMGDSVESAARRPRVKVCEEHLRVRQLLQAGEGGATLVIDEDESDPLR